MAGHTPGPWKYEEVFDRTGSPRAYSVWPCNQSGARNRICMTPDGTTPENKANAIIMAAGPDLLEALKELCDIVEYAIECKSTNDMDSFTLQPARAAIAKAEGRE